MARDKSDVDQRSNSSPRKIIVRRNVRAFIVVPHEMSVQSKGGKWAKVIMSHLREDWLYTSGDKLLLLIIPRMCVPSGSLR